MMQFDLSAMLRQELTSSLQHAERARSQRVDTPTMNDLRSQTGGGTVLYDAVVKASREIMQDRPGRKGLILLTDGVDIGSDFSIADSIEAAQRS